jgi:hypothetical protein
LHVREERLELHVKLRKLSSLFQFWVKYKTNRVLKKILLRRIISKYSKILLSKSIQIWFAKIKNQQLMILRHELKELRPILSKNIQKEKNRFFKMILLRHNAKVLLLYYTKWNQNSHRIYNNTKRNNRNNSILEKYLFNSNIKRINNIFIKWYHYMKMRRKHKTIVKKSIMKINKNVVYKTYHKWKIVVETKIHAKNLLTRLISKKNKYLRLTGIQSSWR